MHYQFFSLFLFLCFYPLTGISSELTWTPQLLNEKTMVTDTTEEFLQPPNDLLKDDEIAEIPPTIEFMYYPEQSYPGNLWSVWGGWLCSEWEILLGDRRSRRASR